MDIDKLDLKVISPRYDYEIDKEKFEAYMLDGNYTNKTLADACGVSPTTVARARAGGFMSPATMRKFCKVFKCKNKDILKG